MKLPTFFLLASYLSLAVSTPLAGRQGSDVNPFANKTFFLNPDYTARVEAEVTRLSAAGNTPLAAKAAKVANVSTFIWITETAAISDIPGYLTAAREEEQRSGRKQIVQMAVYNLPDRDCAAQASKGELRLNETGEARYQTFIQAIASELKGFPDISIVVALEPDSIGNLVSSQVILECFNAAPAHKRLLVFATLILQLPNVYLYLDGAHAAWLGWPESIGPAAAMFGEIVDSARKLNPKVTVRGLVTNVSNFNGLGIRPGQWEDELAYVQALKPLLERVNYPAHFIIDQGRAGNQKAIHSSEDYWCNPKTAGFGRRPTIITPDPIIDAIVWVKPGGDSDGTSDITSPRFDTACISNTSCVPSPEAGEWHSAMFALLIEQADPPF